MPPISKTYFDHEKLEVYKQAIAFVAWVSPVLESLSKAGEVKDQLDRSSTSTPLNIAEGNGKFSLKDRCRYFDSATGSAFESASALDILVAKGKLTMQQIDPGKQMLSNIVKMLVGLIKSLSDRKYIRQEEKASDQSSQLDTEEFGRREREREEKENDLDLRKAFHGGSTRRNNLMGEGQVNGLAVVLLLTRDTGRTAAFYRDVLGLTLHEEEHDGRHKHYACRLGSIYFTIQLAADVAEPEPEPEPGRGHDSLQLCFTVANMNDFVLHLQDTIIVPLHPPQPFEHTVFTTLRDPDGRHVRVMTPWQRG